MIDEFPQAHLLESERVGAEIEGSPSPEAASSTEQLQRQMDELRVHFAQEQARAAAAEREREVAERRRQDTERSWHQLNAEKRQAEERLAQAAQYVQQREQPQLPPPPPPITSADLDSVLADPQRLQQQMDARATYAYQVASQQAEARLQQQVAQMRQEFGQQLQHLQGGLQSIAGPVNGLGAQRAENEARSLLAAKGMDTAKFDENLPLIRQALAQAAQTSGQAVYSDPQAFVLSHLHHEFNSPARAERQEPPMNLRSDVSTSPQAAGGRKGQLSQAERIAVGKLAEHLSPEIAQRVAKDRREGRV